LHTRVVPNLLWSANKCFPAVLSDGAQPERIGVIDRIPFREPPRIQPTCQSQSFLTFLAETCAQFGWRCHAYCLMTNHYHLLLALQDFPSGRLVRGVQHLNSCSAQRFNRRHRRVGHVYQGCYRAILAQRERHLLELTRYVVLNPVRAGMVADAAAWPWSSYRAAVGCTPAPSWLDTDAVTAPFGAGDEGRRAYAAFVTAGVGAPSVWSRLSHQIYLGDQSFIAHARRHGMTRAADPEVATVQRGAPARGATGTIVARARRYAAIAANYAARGETIKTLGTRYGLHYSQISRILSRATRAALHAMEDQ